jgi:hypothetical protein
MEKGPKASDRCGTIGILLCPEGAYPARRSAIKAVGIPIRAYTNLREK